MKNKDVLYLCNGFACKHVYGEKNCSFDQHLCCYTQKIEYAKHFELINGDHYQEMKREESIYD